MNYDYSYRSTKRKNEKEEENNENKKKQKKDSINEILGEDKKLPINAIDNHIYFYSSVSKNSALELNKLIKEVTKHYCILKEKNNTNPPPIYIHINSYGGSVFAALSIIDHIQNNKIPIYSIIEGAAASAATLISVVCDKRFITENAHMLVHQLSSGFWGKMDEIEDEVKNLEKLMLVIRNIYKKNTKIPTSELDEILKHDIWWDAKKCKKLGLIDKIINKNKKKLDVNESLPY